MCIYPATFIVTAKHNKRIYVSIHQLVPPLIVMADIYLWLATHLSTLKGWRLSWPSWLTCSGAFTHKWSPVSCSLSAGHGKFTRQRSTFYHCATQSTIVSSHFYHMTACGCRQCGHLLLSTVKVKVISVSQKSTGHFHQPLNSDCIVDS